MRIRGDGISLALIDGTRGNAAMQLRTLPDLGARRIARCHLAATEITDKRIDAQDGECLTGCRAPHSGCEHYFCPTSTLERAAARPTSCSICCAIMKPTPSTSWATSSTAGS